MIQACKIKPGDSVVFTCPDNGHVKGKIKRIVRDISNGQPHAEIDLETKGWEEPKSVIQPLSNLM